MRVLDKQGPFQATGRTLPTQAESEIGIKEKAPEAIQILIRHSAEDLVEMLGLSPYLEGSNR